MKEEKTIRFLKNHSVFVRGKEVRFKRTDVIEVGGNNPISEEMGRDLIRRGLALPGFSYGKSIKQEG